jgi:hypothetical protein
MNRTGLLVGKEKDVLDRFRFRKKRMMYKTGSG